MSPSRPAAPSVDRIPLAALVVALAFAASTPAVSAPTDATAPARITDLRVSAPTKAPQLHAVLTWTAPEDIGDGSVRGPANRYDIRYSTSAITNDTSFSAARTVAASATLRALLPTPAAPGTVQSVEIVGLTPNRTYYFAIKSIDTAGNVSTLSNVPSGATAKYEGYGYASTGGGDGRICRVTSLGDSGTGTLRNCIFATRSCTSEPLTVVFDVAGKIALTSDVNIGADDCRLTLDGSTAPTPGVTIGMPPCASGLTTCPVGDPCLGGGEFKIGQNEATATDQIVLTYLRFQGNYQQGWAACNDNNAATLGLQYNFSNVVLDHMTIRNGGDAAPDMWTGGYDSHDVSISNSLIAWNSHPLLMGGTAGAGSRDDVSIHHTVIAKGGQRMPKIQASSTDIDFRNNVVYDWSSSWTGWTSGDGTHISPQLTSGGTWLRPTVNLVNNYWYDKSGKPRLGLYYGITSGADADDGGPSSCTTSDNCARCPAQGTVVSGTNVGDLWVSGNILPSANCDHYSTVSAERTVPTDARVTTDTANALVTKVLPQAGTHFRSLDEDALMVEIAVTMGCGNGSLGTGEQCDGVNLGGKTCQGLGFGGGVLACTTLCTFNTSLCTGTTSGSPSPVNNLRRTDKRP